jgi:hypothetical protein
MGIDRAASIAADDVERTVSAGLHNQAGRYCGEPRFGLAA